MGSHKDSSRPTMSHLGTPKQQGIWVDHTWGKRDERLPTKTSLSMFHHFPLNRVFCMPKVQARLKKRTYGPVVIELPDI